MILIVLFLFIVLQTIPVFVPRPLGSKQLSNDNITLYYQSGDEVGANEVFDLLNEKASEIYTLMNYQNTSPTNVYLYKTQWQLSIREAGLVTLLIAPPWHIGDSHNGNIMMVSPYAKIKVHTHDSILQATLHELVHSIVFKVNPDLNYFWDNGLATYLSNQVPDASELSSMSVPSIDQMHTDNGLTFAEMGGYSFSYKYIEYLTTTYGWDNVMKYASGEADYINAFGKTETEIYSDWTSSF